MYITIAAASTCPGYLVALKIRTTTTTTVFCGLHRKYKGWHFVLILFAKEAICMTCQALISGKNKTYILRCCLFSFLVSRLKVITKTRLFKYIENFTNKTKWKFSDKKIWYFSYFCSKHRMWVLVRTASMRSSNEYPQSMFWAKIRKIMYTPVNPSFTI